MLQSFEKYISNFEATTILLKDGIEKVAEERKDISNKIRKFIESIKPDKDKHIYCLVIAMGSGEYWGPNSNNDHFPEEDLFHEGKDYGFETFLDAGIFQGHKNKDKSISLGEVPLAIKNPIMHRVELIERVDRSLCKKFGIDDIYERLLSGEPVGVSMGTKVPYDSCSCCGNRAKTRAEYCDHMRFSAGKILPDGRKVFVYNPKPKFFDISFVNVPADKTARVVSSAKEKDGVICIGNICAIPKIQLEKLESKAENKTEDHSTEKTASIKEADNKKGKEVKIVGKTSFSSIPIHLEYKLGDMRVGYNRGGKWMKEMECNYGFIPKTKGNDKEDIDVYLNPNPHKDSDVFIVKQLKKKDDSFIFDEDKIMLGFPSKDDAHKTYLAHTPAKYFGGIVQTSIEKFKEKYLPTFKKHAENSVMDCNCSNDCCKTAAQKTSDIIKKVPGTMKMLDSSIVSKIKRFHSATNVAN